MSQKLRTGDVDYRGQNSILNAFL